jgi:glycosyltransferase involved in cell wall biosynthesis
LTTFDATVVIPAYNEDLTIATTLELLSNIKDLNLEITVVVDDEKDSTIESVNKASIKPSNTIVHVQNYGRGPANAIRYGIEHANSDCVVVMMADGSDDVRDIPHLVNLVNRGVAVACASRYMPGGQQIGGSIFKKALSRNVGRVLYHFAGVDTHDPTNSFKAYSKDFVRKAGIQSNSGFEIGIELVAKARKARLPIAEIPTIWLDRTQGVSQFKIFAWAPKYLRWFFACFAAIFSKSDHMNEKSK